MLVQKRKTTKETVAAILIAAAFLVCTFAGGGFYWQNTIAAYFLFAACGVLLIRTADLRANLAFFAAAILSILSLAFSVGDFQTGLHEVQKTLLFFAALTLGIALKNGTAIRQILFYTAVAASLLGLLTYCSVLPIDGSVLFDRYIYRLQSVFGYANAAAAFFGCGYFAFLQSYSTDRKKYKLPMGLCILLALYLTVSKACIPIFLAVGTLYVWKETSARSLFIFQSIYTAVFAVLIALCVGAGSNVLAVILTAAFAAFGVLLEIKNRPVYFKIWLFCAAAAAVLFAVLLFRGSLLSTLSLRFTYMRDALPLLFQNPLLGVGPASWQLLQYSVQTTAYSASHIHNGFLEFAVENGILFALLFLAVMAAGLVLAWRRRMHGEASILLFVSLHACLDCDLSFASILLILGCTVGTVISAARAEAKAPIAARVTGIAVSAVLAVTGGYMLYEYGIRNAMESAYTDGEYAAALVYAEKLEKAAPRDSRLQVTIAAIEEKNGADYDATLARLSHAVSLSPKDAGVFRDYMQYACMQENLGELCRTYIGMIPYQEMTYTFLNALVDREAAAARISAEEAEALRGEIDAARIQNSVIDRNDLLGTIAGEK